MDGKTYLDLHTSFGAALLGHGHPRITAAVYEALSRGILCAFEVEASGIAARNLVEMLPCAERVRFSGTGTETTYQVIKLARAFTGNQDVVAVRNSYHGGSPASMALTSHHTWKYPQQINTGIHHAMCPDPYRSPFSGPPEAVANQSAEDIRQVIHYSTPGKIAAFIAEPHDQKGRTSADRPI